VRGMVKAFKALADETRLRMLNVLMERECCVCEVMQALDVSQACASRNLSALENAGLLKMRRDGRWSIYSIDEDAGQEYLGELIRAVAKGLEGNSRGEKDRSRLRSARRVGPAAVRRGVKG